MSLSKNPKDYICETCGLGYGSRQSLWRHKNTKHKYDEEMEDRVEKRKTAQCGLCDLLLVNQYDLCEHLRLSHGLNTTISTLEFDNMDIFSEWRKEQEKTGLFRFTKSRGDANDNDTGNTRQYFYCHRSGEFESKASGQYPERAVRDSVRAGFRCSAFAFSKIDSAGRVAVTYCLDHYKHDNLLSRFPLPEDVVARVGQFLREKRDFDWILDYMRKDYSEGFARQHLITRQDLSNIQRRLGLCDAEKSRNDMDSVGAWITSNFNEADGGEMEVSVLEDMPDPLEHRAMITGILADCMNSIPMITDKEALEKILSKTGELSALVKTLSIGQTPVTPDVGSNKLPEPVRRKKRAITDADLPKPTAQQALTAMKNMANILVQMRNCGLCFEDIVDEYESWIDCQTCKTLLHEDCCGKIWPEMFDVENFVCRACIRLRK